MALTKLPPTMLETSVAASTPPSGENIAPNNQWQLWGQTVYMNKMNSLGTGPASPIAIAGFTVTSGSPTLTASAGTAEVKNGDIGIMGSGFKWGYAGVGYVNTPGQYNTASRVVGLIPGVSFGVNGNFGGVSLTASAATSFQPICPGDPGAGGGASASGWVKTGSLAVWADDFAVNQCPGAIRTLGMRKTGSSQMIHYFVIQAKKLRKYAGRDLVFSFLLYTKVQGGASTSRAFIQDDSGATFSAQATGASYTNPDTSYGGFQLITVTKRITANPTTLFMGVSMDGNSGDIAYMALPTCKYGTSMTIQDLEQRPDELIESIHWNPPLLTPFVINFPGTEIVSGSGLYGWNNIDLEAISCGTIHKSMAASYAKFEWKSGTVGAYIFAADNTSNQHLRFGVQSITNVANINNTDTGEWPMYDDGTISMFGTVANLTGHILTLDFWDARA